jgi:hypothetical protein
MMHDQTTKKVRPTWTRMGADFLSAFIIRKYLWHPAYQYVASTFAGARRGQRRTKTFTL